MLRTLIGIKSLLLLLFISVSISQTVSLQGVLREPSGNTVQDGHFSLTFNLYDQDEGGSALWTETHGSVPVKHGVYAVELGSLTSFNDLTFSVQYYVGISVQSGAELTPRVKLTNSPTTMAVFGVENVFPSSGNVGVGTTDPQALLHIEQIGDDQDLLKIDNGASILKVTSNGDLYIPNSINFTDGSILSTAQGGTASSLSSAGNAVIVSDNDDDATGDIQFRIGESSQMVIKNSGNVGISTDTPLHALHVNDNVEDIAMFENTAGSAAINIKSSSDYTGVKFIKGDSLKWWIGQDDDNDFYLYDYTDAAVKMKFWQDTDAVSIYGGDIYLNADSHVDGTLDVTGNTDLSGTLGVTGNTDITGTFGVTGNTDITGTLGVTGNTDITGTFGVTGNTDITGTLDVSGVLEVSGTAGINLNSPDDSNSLLRFKDGGVSKFALIARSTDDLFGIYDYTAGFDRMQFWGSDIEMQFANATNIVFGKRDGGGGYNDCSIFPDASNNGNIGTPNNFWYETHTKNIYRTNEYNLSDRSTKLNIQSLVGNRSNSTNLDKVLALNPVKYDINLDTHPFYKNADLKEGELEESKDNLGFIAQELMEVIPEMVSFNKSQQLYSIRNYEQMFPVLVGAMQEMKAENDDLKSRIERLEALLNKE
jgi:hypothetical protein